LNHVSSRPAIRLLGPAHGLVLCGSRRRRFRTNYLTIKSTRRERHQHVTNQGAGESFSPLNFERTYEIYTH
jgi:hypothetical protein